MTKLRTQEFFKKSKRQENQVKASERNKTILTVEALKEYGTFVEYSDDEKGFIYVMNEDTYLMNGRGVMQIG